METKKNNVNEQLQQPLDENELDQVTGGMQKPNGGFLPGQAPPAPGTPGYAIWLQNQGQGWVSSDGTGDGISNMFRDPGDDGNERDSGGDDYDSRS